MSAREPVTVSGWYEESDGTVAHYRWTRGNAVRGTHVRDWASASESERQSLIGPYGDALYREACARDGVVPYAIKIVEVRP